jgi:hypothetical protein
MSEENQGGWHEIVALHETTGEPLSVGNHRVFVRGAIGDVTIVQVDIDPDSQRQQAELMAVGKALEVSGIEKALIMPSSVRFMRLRRVSDADAVRLTEQADGKAVVTLNLH